MKFTATTIGSGGKAGIEIPESAVEALGGSRRPAVTATIKGHAWRTSIASMGGKFMLGVNADVRAATGVAAGDVVELSLELDTQPRVLEVPADLTAALEKDPDSRAFFEAQSYSNRRRHVMALEAIKGADTRARRVQTLVAMFRDGKI